MSIPHMLTIPNLAGPLEKVVLIEQQMYRPYLMYYIC